MRYIWLLLFPVSWTQVAGNQVTSDYCYVCPDHTMCVYPIKGPQNKKRCGTNFRQTPLSIDEMDGLLEEHNKYRNNVARGDLNVVATNMRKLNWDTELASIAQRWADQCVVSHRDACRDTPTRKVAQNVYAFAAKHHTFESDVIALAHNWYLQGKTFQSSMVQRFNHTEVSAVNALSYSQLIWAGTDSLGCGRSVFTRIMSTADKKGTEEVVVEYLVCNYAPAGNVDGEDVFRIGLDAASECPTGTTPDGVYSGLCRDREREEKRMQVDWMHLLPDWTEKDDVIDSGSSIFRVDTSIACFVFSVTISR